MRRLFLLCLALLGALGAHAQTQLLTESFATTGGYTINELTTTTSGSNNQYFLRSSVPVTGFTTQPTGSTDNWVIAGEGVRGPAGAAPIRVAGTVALNPYNVAGKTNLQARVSLADARGAQATGVWENTDFIRVKARLDGGTWVIIGGFASDGASNGVGYMRRDADNDGVFYPLDTDDTNSPRLTLAFQEFTFPVTGTGTTLEVMVEFDYYGLSEEAAIDYISLYGSAASSAAPVLAGLETTSLAYSEGGAATAITGSLTVNDADHTTASGATVKIATNYVSGQDVLATTPPVGSGITASFNPADGTLSLVGTSSLANYQTALRNVTYVNTNSTNATGGNRVVTFTVVDPTGVTSNAVSRTITITVQLNAAAALPYTEGFESDGEGTRYSSNTFRSPGVNCLGFFRTTLPVACSPQNFTGFAGSSVWYAEGTTLSQNPDPLKVGILQLAPVNATNTANLHLNLRLASGVSATHETFEASSYLKVYYQVGTGSYTLLAAFYGTGAANGQLQRDTDLNGTADGATYGPALQNVDLALPANVTGSEIRFRIEVRVDGQEEVVFDELAITGTLNNAPVISAQTRTVSENAPNGTSVGAAIAATDPDGNTLTYAITGGNTGGAFAINASSGQLTVANSAALDFETTPSFALTVQVTDNGTPASSASATVTVNLIDVDEVRPTVSIGSGASNPTSTSPIPVTVSFSESVTGLTLAEVVVSNGTASNLSGSGASYSVSITPTGAGPVTVNLAAGVAEDAAGNGNTAAAPFSITYTLPSTTVTAVSRGQLSPTAMPTVTYTVTFAGNISGISTSNFSLTTTGISGAGVTSVSGSGSMYKVTVNTGTGNGTLRLDVANSTGINPTVTNVPFTTGQEYTITKSFTNPVLSLQGTGGTGSDVTVFVDQVRLLLAGTSTAVPGVSNGSFESYSPLGNGTFGYNPTAPGWTFNSRSGIALNGSLFSPPAAPDGTAVAFVQSAAGNGALQQPLLASIGSYQVNFQAAQRTCCSSQDQVVNVFINGVHVGSSAPSSTSTYQAFTSAPFTVEATAPTDLTLSNSSVAENATINTGVGTFSTTSATAGDTYTYTLVNGPGATDNGDFSISGNTLLTARVFDFETKASYSVRVRATSSTDPGLVYEEVLTISVTDVDDTAPSAPVVLLPTNGRLLGTATPTYSGTAEVGSTVSVSVDGSLVGTTTATDGSWSLLQPGALSEGSHTVSARATDAANNTGPTSNTNNFTIDVTAPTVSIGSGASSPTSTSPIPVTVSFSESVTGLTLAEVVVSNGTASNLSGSGASYSVSITPTGAGPVTVNLAAGVAEDAAGNGNTAAAPLSITYTLPSTATSWTGVTSVSWYEASNWTNGVPTATLDATIPSGANRYPAISSGTALTRSLTIDPGASLTQTAGTLNLKGNWVNNGTFTATGGTVAFSAASNQSAGGSSLSRFWNLRVEASGVTLAGAAALQRLLTLTGTLSTNGQTFTLLSDAGGTALVVNAGGTVVGPATVQRYLDPSRNSGLGYRHYSAPVSGSTVADLATPGFTPEVSQASAYNASATPGKIKPFPTVFAYDQKRVSRTSTYAPFDRGFVVPAGLGSSLEVGRGYAVHIAGTEKVDFTGTLTTGNVDVSLERLSDNVDAGWALVGNPYPAPLDGGQLFESGNAPGLDQSFYVLESTGPYAGMYRAYVRGFERGEQNALIASGQGFFVRVSQNSTSGQLRFRDAQRVTNPNTQVAMYRGGSGTQPTVALALQADGGQADPLFVYADAQATPGFDSGYDAWKLPNTSGLNLSSRTAQGQGLSIDGRPAFTATTRVELAVGVPTAGTYTISATSLAHLPAGLEAYLHDAVTGQLTKLSSGTSYRFSVTATQALALLTGRFTLQFSGGVALGSAAAADLAAQVSVYPNPASSRFTVLVPPIDGGRTVEATLLNSLGQVVRRQVVGLNPSTGARFGFETGGLSQGVYSLRLRVGSNAFTKRVVLH
ncbi:T9SS type A sorting domain-containing protein [Hymenobacter sp. BT18]|uniref:Ig-like domain-containing protein n=1 Tax=Hymenobacter sp. BT18 TaxID=2835648 RepID=UPI00143E43CB|nr:Ig-like domain-containing protein [Hymenobacter sp. BT18]QIX59831.1 T9SS type A sorting domain-containing protein [Hymenobacter sp. BT18]